ncbi:MAG: hypothetical protein P9L88_00210 [Candidatus Tantalella remota]|nr:hypothetical protein [Candidatus Tantalella remota]
MRISGYQGIRLTGAIVAAFLLTAVPAQGEEQKLFATTESREEFAADISSIIEKAWKRWQDSVLIEEVDVEGSQGLLFPGDMRGPVLTSADIIEYLDRKGRSQEYISSVRAIAGALADGMRLWQKGYSNRNIPFSQGASCTYTMPPCNNVPVSIASGRSSGDTKMTKKALYNYMLYRAPVYEKEILEVFQASAKAIVECFEVWKNSCSIVGILASGGIAPQPSPLGQGPGPVRGAKGREGKLVGAYFSGDLMKKKMAEYFRSEEREK